MKNFFKKSLITLLALIMVLASMNAFAFAASGDLFEVTGYKITKFNGSSVTDSGQFTINKGDTVDIQVTIKCNTTTDDPGSELDVSRLVDSFNGGSATAKAVTSTGGKTYTIDVAGLKYKGSGHSLNLMVQKATAYENISVTISETKEYTEPKEDDSSSTYTPDPIPAPKAIFSRNELTSDLAAGKTESVTITVKNVGKAVMQNPVLTLTTSDAITIVGGTSAYELSNIAIGKTASVTVQVKALSKIESATQYIDAELDFDYYNRVSTQSTTAEGKITVPAKVTTKTEEKTDETKTASPVPNIIVTKFNYGGSSVAAGSDFNFSISFKNTSSKLNVENLVVTVDPGTVLTLNGSSNSFYFDKIKPGKSKSISVPMKAQKTLEVNAETVTVSFKYEYVDNKTRTQATADSKLTVPVYQPDRFEIDDPVLEDYITEGTDTTITLNYVNKSKATISNVQATIEGDLTSSLATQNVGNLEAGKSGSIVFSVAPAASGECNYTITIDYEDGNGDEKERVFTGTMNVEEAYIDDGGDYVDDGGDGTDEQTSGIPWWVFVIIAVVVIIAAIIILKKVKKAKLAKKEQELWDSWDEELGGGSDSGSADANNDKGDK